MQTRRRSCNVAVVIPEAGGELHRLAPPHHRRVARQPAPCWPMTPVNHPHAAPCLMHPRATQSA